MPSKNLRTLDVRSLQGKQVKEAVLSLSPEGTFRSTWQTGLQHLSCGHSPSCHPQACRCVECSTRRASAQKNAAYARSQGDLGSYCATAIDLHTSNGEGNKTVQFPAILCSCVYPGPKNRCSCENTSHPAGRPSNREKERTPRCSLHQSTNVYVSCMWQSYQIHTVHRKSPNTGALRPSISNGKWDNVLSQEKSKHRGIAAVNFEWQMGQCLIPWRAPPCVCRGRRIFDWKLIGTNTENCQGRTVKKYWRVGTSNYDICES